MGNEEYIPLPVRTSEGACGPQGWGRPHSGNFRMVMRRVIERENWSGVSNFNSRHTFSDRTLGLRGPLAWPAVLNSRTRELGVEFRFPPSVSSGSYYYIGRRVGRTSWKQCQRQGGGRVDFMDGVHVEEEKWKIRQKGWGGQVAKDLGGWGDKIFFP